MAEILYDDVFSNLCEERRKYKYSSLPQKFQILWPVRDTGYRAGFLVAFRSADLSASHEHLVGEGLVESKELH